MSNPRIELTVNGQVVMSTHYKEAAESAARMLDGCKRVLEIGYGLGWAHRILERQSPERLVVIEPLDIVPNGVDWWRGCWQDVLPNIPADPPFDGVLFDTDEHRGTVPEFPVTPDAVIVWFDMDSGYLSNIGKVA